MLRVATCLSTGGSGSSAHSRVPEVNSNRTSHQHDDRNNHTSMMIEIIVPHVMVFAFILYSKGWVGSTWCKSRKIYL